MADPKKSSDKKAKKPAGPKRPKFSARLVKGDSVIRVRTGFKFHSNTYEATALLYRDGDTAPGGKGTRAESELIEAVAGKPTFAEAEEAAKALVQNAVAAGYTPQEKAGKRTAIGWDAV